jgi:hypothetical protein
MVKLRKFSILLSVLLSLVGCGSVGIASPGVEASYEVLPAEQCRIDGKEYSLGAAVTSQGTHFRCSEIYVTELNSKRRVGWVPLKADFQSLAIPGGK